MKHVLVRSSVWGDQHRVKSAVAKRRCFIKRSLLQRFAYPYLDHEKIFAWKREGQRGAPKESQTLVAAHAYKTAMDAHGKYQSLVGACEEIGLCVTKKETAFRGQAAYQIVIADKDVDAAAATIEIELMLQQSGEQTVAAVA